MSAKKHTGLYWLLMISGGVATGAGAAMTLRWGLQKMGFLALGGALVGLAMLVLGVLKLIMQEERPGARRPTTHSGANGLASARGGDTAGLEQAAASGDAMAHSSFSGGAGAAVVSGSGRAMAGAGVGAGAGAGAGAPAASRSHSETSLDEPMPEELQARDVCSFILHEMDRVLEMLKRARGADDIASLESPTQELELWASELSVKKAKLKLSGRKVKQLWEVKDTLAALEREWIVRTGGDPLQDGTRAWRLGESRSETEREDHLNRCSERVALVARQFEEHPEFRNTLTSVARSIRVYLGRPQQKRKKSSGEEAFAATLRLPDLPTLERMIQELKDLEESRQDEGFEGRSEQAIKTYKLELKKLLASTGSPESVAAWPKLKELSAGLKGAAHSLESGKFDEARRQLDSVLKVVRESPVGGAS